MTESAYRIGVVGVPGGWSSEALADALGNRTGYRLLVDIAQVALDLDRGGALFGDVDLCELDGLVVKKIGAQYGPEMLDRLELLRFVADSGVRVFSKPLSILRLMDRLACTVTLSRARIPMPPTVVTEDLRQAAAAVRRFGEAVLKPLYSTKAQGMRLVRADDADLMEQLASFKTQHVVLYVQKKLDLPDRDYGLVFMGGEHVGSYARIRGEGAWNTTIRAGGSYAHFESPREIVELARRAQDLFDLDFTSVDVVESKEGPLVFEVSAFGGFRGMREGAGIDLADRYAAYAISKLGTGNR